MTALQTTTRLLCALALAACSSPQPSSHAAGGGGGAQGSTGAAPGPAANPHVPLAGAGGGATPAPQPQPQPAYAGNDPRVSRSAGVEGGVVVLYPRVIPSKHTVPMRAPATAVQRALQSWAAEALPGRPQDVRPEPERVCPRGTGCLGVAVGALLLTDGKGCAVLLRTSAPGKSAQFLTPWVGETKLKKPNPVPFREPPESHVTIYDFQPCAKVAEQLDAQKALIVDAIRNAGR